MDAVQQTSRLDAKCFGEADNRAEPRVTSLALEARDLRGMDPCASGQLLLREPGVLPVPAHVLAKLLRGHHRSHTRRAGRMSPEPITQIERHSRAEVARLLQLAELAGHHQRAARARQLGAQQIELCALEHLVAMGPLAPGELAHRLGLSSGGVTGLASRLIEAGWVNRAPHPRDRRMRVLTVTESGEAHLADYLQPILDSVAQALRWLSPADAEQVGRVLDVLLSFKERAAAATPGPDKAREADEKTSALLM